MSRSGPEHLSSILVAAVVAVLAGLSWPVATPSAAAQESPPTAVPAPVEEAPTYPDRSQAGPRYLELVDRAAGERRRLADLARTAELEADTETAREQAAELAEAVERVLASSRRDVDDLLEARGAVTRHRDALAALVERSSLRIAEVDRIRESWEESREMWSGWRQELRQRGTLDEFADDFQRADEVIAGVLVAARQAVAALAAAQEPVRRLQEADLELLERLDATLATRRAALLERDAPTLFTAAYLEELEDAERWADMDEAVSRLHWPDRAYFVDVAPRLAALLLIALAGYLVARHFRRRFPRAEERWRVLLSHPLAIGLFVATAFSPLLFEAPPPLWRLALLTVLAVSAMVLTSGTFRNPRKRRVAYALAVFFVLASALETASLPGPAYRLFTVLASGAGLPFLLVAARRERREAGSGGWVLLLRAGASVLAAVLVAQLAGWANLARWLMENALATAFIAFTTVFLLRLGKGALRATLRRPHPEARRGRRLTLRRVGHELSPHLARGLEVVLVGLALLYVLTVWGVFESPWRAWGTLTAAGVDLAGHRITVARVLLGALALYLAFAASRVTRAMVGEELGRNPELEPGVADSVSTLAHYALVLLGLVVAVATLGFDLSTFAILAGALGVGIGFGLQDMVNNFLSGLILLFERPVRVGDVVVIDGQWATIRKIGLRATVVTTFDMADVIVPNGNLTSEKVTNWTLSDAKTRIMIHIGVAYGSDLETVFQILREVAAEDPRVAEDPPPLVHFEDFGDSSLRFTLRVWVLEITDRLDVRSDLLRQVDHRFREAGVRIPFPQRDVHLFGEAAGDDHAAVKARPGDD